MIYNTQNSLKLLAISLYNNINLTIQDISLSMQQKNRNSQSLQSINDSESFEDLNIQNSAPSNGRTSSSQEADLMFKEKIYEKNKTKKQLTKAVTNIATKNHDISENSLKTQNFIQMKENNIALLEKTTYLKKQNNCLKEELKKKDIYIEKLQNKLKLIIEQNSELILKIDITQQAYKKMESIIKEKQKFVLTSYETKLESCKQQLQSYQFRDRQIRDFLQSNFKIQTGQKSTKQIIQSLIAQLQKNLLDLSQQIHDIMHILGQSKSQIVYNHYQQIRNLQKIGQLIIKLKDQNENQQSQLKNLSYKIKKQASGRQQSKLQNKQSQ